MVISLVLDLSSITLNGLIAYVIKKDKKTRIVTFWYIYCLSISDVMIGATGLIHHWLLLYNFLDPFNASWTLLHIILGVIYGYFTMTSWMLILIIAIDRYIHMKYPHNYNLIMTRFRARLIMLFDILFGILVSLPPMLIPRASIIWFQFSLYIFFALGSFMTFLLYFMLYFVIKRQVNALQVCHLSHKEAPDAPRNSTDSRYIASVSQHCYESDKAEISKKINAGENFDASNSYMTRKENSVYQEPTKENHPLPVYNTIGSSSPNENYKKGNNIDEQPSSVDETFQVNREKNRDFETKSNHMSECQCKVSFAQNCKECVTVKLTECIGNPLGLKLLDDHNDHQNAIFVLPYSNYFSNCKWSKSDDVESVTDNMVYASNAVPFPVTEIRVSNQRSIESRRPISQPAGAGVNQALRRRWRTPNDEVRKATWLILFAVFICYAPGLIISFHYFVTGTQNVAMSFISQLSVLLNSSLNAVILIVCSKNIQRKVKALFTRTGRVAQI